MLASNDAEVAAMMPVYVYVYFFLLYKSKNTEGHVYISPDAPCFPATLTAAIQCLRAEHNYTIERY